MLNEEKSLVAMCKFLLWLFTALIITIIGITNVSALSYEILQHLESQTVVYVSTDYGAQPFNVPQNSGYNFNQVLQVDYILSNYSFQANTNYQLESYIAQQVFTNVNYYSVQGLNGESCLISYDNSILNNDHYPRWAFECPHSTNTVTISIKNSNGEYLWSGSGIYDWRSSILKKSSTSLGSGNSDSDSIINNQNQNTQSIINNQNQNTQDIIDNQNQNTQDIINETKNLYLSCANEELILNSSNSVVKNRLDDDGNLISTNAGYAVTEYLMTYENFTLTLTVNAGNLSTVLHDYYKVCFYDEQKNLISCTDLSNAFTWSGTTETINIITPNNTVYFKIAYRYNIDRLITTLNYKKCVNKLDEQTNAINGLNDNLNDDDTTGATSEASDFFSSFTTNTFGLTSIITAPLNLIQSLTSSTCSDLHLPLPYLNNKYLDLPCMTSIYQTHFGAFFTMYQTITYGIIAYWVCVRIFNQVKDFKNPEHDEIEVVDL